MQENEEGFDSDFWFYLHRTGLQADHSEISIDREADSGTIRCF
jgi:hypothetical protein